MNCLVSKRNFWFGPCLLGLTLLLASSAPAATVTEAWVRRYNFDGISSSDAARKVVADASGNVIVAGNTDGGVTGSDILIIKYSGAGLALWTNRYDQSLRDEVGALALDATGNVIIAGSSDANTSGGDMLIVKYSGAGVPLWTNRYSGPGYFQDAARAMAVDGSGNVFVTGSSQGQTGGNDYATIAWSGAGLPLWTNRYDGPGNTNDAPTAIAVDASGNVFVTGSSQGQTSGNDYATIAYSGAGLPLWTNRHHGGALGDFATDLALDGSGNVFVTGYEYEYSDPHFRNIASYATVAYSSTGTLLWVRRHNPSGDGAHFARAIELDDSGTVFVTGSSATIAYSGAGFPLWTNSGPFGSVADMAVAGTGDVIVTGSSAGYVTVAYTGAGLPLWTNRYSGTASAVAVDSSGNVFVTGSSLNDYATIAYSPAGATLWTNRYNSPLNQGERAADVAVANNGNVFVTGSSRGASGYAEYHTVAYSEAGIPLWTNRYGVPNDTAQPAALAVDGSGNVFVTGFSTRDSGFALSDYTTIAYTAAGMPLWTNHYKPGGQDIATAIATDRHGNVLVTGRSQANGSWHEFATIKYSGAGIPFWTNRFAGAVFAFNEARAIAIDGSDNVFITGPSGGAYATVAYSASGALLWTNRYYGPGINHEDEANAIAVAGSGNVFVTGSSADDYATIAYSPAGIPLWTNRYNGPANSTDYAVAVATHPNGNVFVTGWSLRSGQEADYATVAYSAAGMPLWTHRYNGPGNSDDRASAMILDRSGNVCVTGSSGSDYVTIAYSPAGALLWTIRYNGPANGPDSPVSLASGPDGGLYVTGSSDADFDLDRYIPDYATVKYITSKLRILPPSPGSADVNLTLSAAPNSSWTIQRALSLTGPWTNLGTVTNDINGAGQFHDTPPPPGAAFYRARQP